MLEPYGYLEQYRMDANQGFDKSQLKKVVHDIVEESEERLLYNLLKEEAANPFRRNFMKVFSIITLCMIITISLSIWAIVCNVMFNDSCTWQMCVVLSLWIASIICTYACRAVLRNYVEFVILHRNKKDRPA